MKALLILVMALGCLLLAACGRGDEDAGDVAPCPQLMEGTTLGSIPGTLAYVSSSVDTFPGTGTPPLSERIHDSDVVVRARLQSTTRSLMRFRAIEYLKGRGTVDFVVKASTRGRITAWDDREAVLFLSLPENAAPDTSGAVSGNAPQVFCFTDTQASNEHYPYSYRGYLPNGYSIDTRNPVWLPAAAVARAGGSSGVGLASGSDPMFITDARPVPRVFTTDARSVPRDALPPITSLAYLRAKIAWMEGGAGIAGYDECVQASVTHERLVRDWNAYYGRWRMSQFHAEVASGAGKATVVADYGSVHLPGYNRSRLTGKDAALFNARNVDNDTVASNGYVPTIATVRPLPGGVYRFVHNTQSYNLIPCDFISTSHSQGERVVTVAAPPGTLHEAFFDPTAIGSAVGETGVSGSISSLTWESGVVTLDLSAMASLSDWEMDVIELDGSVSLTLVVAAAASNAGGTLTWDVADQPWHAGDQLMLRLRAAG